MGEFFQGWKRKAGLVTLVFACFFSAWLVCGYWVSDSIQFSVGHVFRVGIVSTRNSFSFAIDSYSDDERNGWHVLRLPNGTPIATTDFGGWHFDFTGRRPTHTKSELNASVAGGDISSFADPNAALSSPAAIVEDQEIILPSDWMIYQYHGIVIPLTLISAWALLSKTHKSTPKKTTEPIPEKVV